MTDNRNHAIHDALNTIINEGNGILTGWVVVAETTNTDGERYLHRIDGPETITSWAREGLLHNALFANWDTTEDDDDD